MAGYEHEEHADGWRYFGGGWARPYSPLSPRIREVDNDGDVELDMEDSPITYVPATVLAAVLRKAGWTVEPPQK